MLFSTYNHLADRAEVIPAKSFGLDDHTKCGFHVRNPTGTISSHGAGFRGRRGAEEDLVTSSEKRGGGGEE